jgi:hypothetical protein
VTSVAAALAAVDRFAVSGDRVCLANAAVAEG